MRRCSQRGRRAWLGAMAALGGVAACGTATAQEGEGADSRVALPAWSVSLTPRGQVDFRGDLKDGPGSVTVYRGGASLDVGVALTEHWQIGLGTSVEASSYRFRNATTLIAGTAQPWNDVYIVNLTPAVTYALNERWAVTVGGMIEFAGEGGADVGESFTGGGFVSVRHKCTDTFAISLGVAAKSRLEDEAWVLPLIGVQWQVSEGVRLSSRGPGAEVEARLGSGDEWALVVDARYESREFRLSDESPLPEGVVRDRRVPIGVGLRWRPAENLKVELRGGVTAWQEYQVDDRTGLEQAEVNTKPTPFLGLSVEFRF